MGFVKWMYDRIIGNHWTTIIGGLLVVATEAVNYFLALNLSPAVHGIVGVIATLLTLSKDSILEWSKKLPPVLPVLLILSLSSCAILQKGVMVGTAEVQACGQQAVELYNDVVDALNTTEWESKLTKLATCLPDGIAVVKCALTAYLQATEAHPAPLAAAVGYERVESAQRVRAKAWIVAH